MGRAAVNYEIRSFAESADIVKRRQQRLEQTLPTSITDDYAAALRMSR